ncbi:MAG TPA: hypothetical protein VK400_05490 [Pyrinomonadaceae bacterium]|nr:hypothetical protein [Pyrinomonadaceae bacterium]
MKIATFLITALANAAIGFVLFFVLIMSLNGFSEEQAKPGLLLFIVWGLLSAIITGVSGILLANYLATKKAMNKVGAAAIASAVSVLAGGVSGVVGFFAAIILVSAMR